MKPINRWIGRASVIAVAVLAVLAALAFATMDNPIPPLHRPLQLTKGTGYCVSVSLGDRFFGKVMVPLHTPDPAKLDELRMSVANSYRLIALQVDNEADAAALRAAADNVKFAGEPDTQTADTRAPTVAFASFRKNPRGGGVTCACATYYDGSVVGAKHACGGECSNCYICR